MEHAFGGWPDASAVLAAHARTARLRHTPRLLLRSGGSDDPYGTTIGALFRAVASVSGADVIVDSTRRPPEALLLLKQPGFDVRFVHLVRDPRAVAHSWAHRVKERPEGGYLQPHSPGKSTVHWITWNLASELLCRGRPSLRLRYEDFAVQPAAALRSAASLFRPGHALPAGPEELTVPPGTAFHVLAGNPVRSESSPRSIRPDDDWRRQQPPLEKLLIAAMAWPLLLRYGYLRRGR